MPCVSYCLLGSVFLGSSVLTMMTSKSSKVFTHMMNTLDDNQKQIYKSIISERLSIYIQTLVIGVIVGSIAVFNVPKNTKYSSKLCLFVFLALGINYLGYSLYPKSTYMLQHLTSPQQNKAWLAIYKEMKFRCIFGMVLGIIGYLILGQGLCT